MLPLSDGVRSEPSLSFEEAEALLCLLAGRSPLVETDFSREVNEHEIQLGGGAALLPVRSEVAQQSWDQPTLHAILNAVPDALIVIDATGSLVMVSGQTERMFEYSREELLGQPVEVLIPERYRARHFTLRASYVANPRVRPMGAGLELFGRKKNGSEFPVEISLSPLATAGGPLVTGTIRDVSSRREAETNLRNAETRYRTLVEEIPAVTLLAALDEGAAGISELYVSPQIEKLLGFSQAEWLADPVLWYTRLHPEDREHWHTQFARTCSLAEPFDAVYRFIARDGGIVWVHGHAKVIRDASGRPLFLQGIAFDITERMQAQQEAADLNRHLEQRVERATADAERRAQELARSNSDLDRFAYIASHDLREPLRTMLWYVQSLEKRYGAQFDEPALGYLAKTINNIRQMNQLISDLHVHSRIGREGQPAPTSTAAAFAEACGNLRVAIEESGASISVGQMPDVLGINTLLVILFQNLLQNAIKFRSDRPPFIDVGARPYSGSQWVFWVRDNGIGIEEQYFEKIFGLGERLHGRKIAGTGFGLANCQRIVERHGGTIWVDSEVGQGSTFSFVLPVSGTAPGRAVAVPSERPA